MFTSAAACLRGASSPDALVASTIIGGAILFLCDQQRANGSMWTPFRVNNGFMTALTRAGFSGMRQADEDQPGVSGIARLRGVQLGLCPSAGRSERGSRGSKQHTAIDRIGVGVELRGRTP
jgi:hypothetical protein